MAQLTRVTQPRCRRFRLVIDRLPDEKPDASSDTSNTNIFRTELVYLSSASGAKRSHDNSDLALFEEPGALVVGHRFVENRLLAAGEVQQVLDNVVAEGPADKRALVESRNSVLQRVRNAW
jgi:hypothetical protein